jgi:hypothetical protein
MYADYYTLLYKLKDLRYYLSSYQCYKQRFQLFLSQIIGMVVKNLYGYTSHLSQTKLQ